MTNRWIRVGLVCCVAAGLLLVGWSAVRSQRQAPKKPGVPQLGVLQSGRKPIATVGEMNVRRQTPAPSAAELNASMKVRRDYAWEIVERAWAPVKVQGGEIPTWMTWYEEEDVAELYKEVVAKDMATPQSKPPTIAEVKANVAALLKRHNSKDLQASLTSARLGKVLRQFSFSQVHNLGPNRKPSTGAIYYSPAYVKHLLENAASIANCDPTAPPRRSGAPNLYAQCMDDEMPTDAVMIKTAWAQFNDPFHYVVTSAPQISNGITATPTGKWIDLSAQPTSYCCQPGQFTVTDENGVLWGLLGMHIASKELRTWMWTSVFWQNFGWDWATDQPQTLSNQWQTGGYGMCTVTDFKESDPAPWSAYNGGGNFATLPNAIKAVYQVMNGAQWCANPFIEPDMSRGNCIGCHQGSPNSALPTTLTKDRQTNPSDFSFSFDTNRANIIQIRKEYALSQKLKVKP